MSRAALMIPYASKAINGWDIFPNTFPIANGIMYDHYICPIYCPKLKEKAPPEA